MQNQYVTHFLFNLLLVVISVLIIHVLGLKRIGMQLDLYFTTKLSNCFNVGWIELLLLCFVI